MAFELWGIESTTVYSPYALETTQEWKTIKVNTTITDYALSHNNALVFYTLSTTGTFYVGDVSITLDTDIELFAHWTKKSYSTGTTLNIEGTKYIILEQKENNQVLVMTADSIGDRAFQSKFDWGSGLRPNGQNASTYEDSEIDNYLENDWYNSLSSTMKVAIQSTSIKQASYATSNDPDSKQETGYNGQVYNTIDRHAFLPSVSEIGKAVDLKNPDKVKAFLVPIHSEEREDDTYIWTRDSSRDYANGAMYLESYWGGLDHSPVGMMYGVRPAFVIDLSKVDYTVTGTVNYK